MLGAFKNQANIYKGVLDLTGKPFSLEGVFMTL